MKTLKTFESFFEKQKTEIFFRKSRSPQDDIKRNFSCYADGWYNNYEDAYKHYKTHGIFSEEPRQDPVSGRWCGYVESGLSGYLVKNEKGFDEAMYDLTECYPHIQDIKKISVFSSSNYLLEDGSDAEDTFTNATYLFDIELNTTYKEYLKLIKKYI